MLKKIVLVFLILIIGILGGCISGDNEDENDLISYNMGLNGLYLEEEFDLYRDYYVWSGTSHSIYAGNLKIINNSGQKIENVYIKVKNVKLTLPFSSSVDHVYKTYGSKNKDLIANEEATYFHSFWLFNYRTESYSKEDFYFSLTSLERIEEIEIEYSYYYNNKNDFKNGTIIIKNFKILKKIEGWD